MQVNEFLDDTFVFVRIEHMCLRVEHVMKKIIFYSLRKFQSEQKLEKERKKERKTERKKSEIKFHRVIW